MPRELWKGAIRFGLVHIPVSLYPAESRKWDESNKYHLWGYRDGARFPIGFEGRKVDETERRAEGKGNSGMRQRGRTMEFQS